MNKVDNNKPLFSFLLVIETRVEDPDGHVLGFGTDPITINLF